MCVCVLRLCIVCLCVHVYMCVCLFVCVYECYVCMIINVSALSAGVGGVWRSEAVSYECVCVLRVYIWGWCVHVCMCVSLVVCVRVLRVYDNSCACSLCRFGWSVEE